MQPRDLDARVAELAGRQHGVVGRSQLLGLGMGEDAVDGWRRRGRLHRLYPGVYALGHDAVTIHGRWMAAVLASGPGAVLSHRTAAALWGIREPGSGPIEVTVPSKGRSPGRIRRHSSSIPPDEMITERGIPVTTVPRTIFDLAATTPVDNVEFAMREAEYLRLYDALSLWDLLERYPGRRGARTVRTCLARRTEQVGRVRSPLEEIFLPFLRRHALPLPRLNAWLRSAGRRYQVDCLWGDRRVIIEMDGFQGHGTRTAFRRDRERDRRLRVAGYEVTRIAWGQLDEEPQEIAADLRALLTPEGRDLDGEG
jgi:very-short-patch-repair endonuclease